MASGLTRTITPRITSSKMVDRKARSPTPALGSSTRNTRSPAPLSGRRQISLVCLKAKPSLWMILRARKATRTTSLCLTLYRKSPCKRSKLRWAVKACGSFRAAIGWQDPHLERHRPTTGIQRALKKSRCLTKEKMVQTFCKIQQI